VLGWESGTSTQVWLMPRRIFWWAFRCKKVSNAGSPQAKAERLWRLGSSNCSSNTLDAGSDLGQGMGERFVGAERLGQRSVERFVVTPGEGDSPIALDRLSCVVFGSTTNECSNRDAFDGSRLLKELLVAAGKLEIEAIGGGHDTKHF
jgi:hypothetical protein